MSDTTTERPAGAGIVQSAWKPSVVKVGDRITGTCVTIGTQYTGTVAAVHGPIRSPDCGGYRYQLTDTGEFYGSGRPIEPIVRASTWAGHDPAELEHRVHGTEHNADLYAALTATEGHVFVAGEPDTEAWCLRCEHRARIRDDRSVVLLPGTPCSPTPPS